MKNFLYLSSKDFVTNFSEDGSEQMDMLLEQMEKLFKQAEEARVSICQGLSSHYVNLSSTFMDMSRLQAKLKASHQEISSLEANIEDEVSGELLCKVCSPPRWLSGDAFGL